MIRKGNNTIILITVVGCVFPSVSEYLDEMNITGSVIRTCRSIQTEFSQSFHNGIIMFLYSFESSVHVV